MNKHSIDATSYPATLTDKLALSIFEFHWMLYNLGILPKKHISEFNPYDIIIKLLNNGRQCDIKRL